MIRVKLKKNRILIRNYKFIFIKNKPKNWIHLNNKLLSIQSNILYNNKNIIKKFIKFKKLLKINIR